MATYVYIGRDGPRGRELRGQIRDQHLAHIEGLDQQGRIRFAGPLRDENGQPCGSVIVLDADNLQGARAIAESDPYLTGGVFEGVEVFETMAVFPKATG